MTNNSLEKFIENYNKADEKGKEEMIENMPDLIYLKVLLNGMEESLYKCSEALSNSDIRKHFSENEIKKAYLTKYYQQEECIKKLIAKINGYKKRVRKNQKKKILKPAKFNQNNSTCFTDKLAQEIINNHRTAEFIPTKNEIATKEILKDFGNLKICQEIKEKDKSYILKNYKNICFSREEIQIYIALLNVYMQNTLKKNYGAPYEFSTKDFHNNIMGRKNRLRKTDLQRYESIFQMIRSKTIIYNTDNSYIPPYNNKNMKNIRINDNLLNISIVTLSDYKDQIIRIVPSALTMLELTSIKSISNFLPTEFLKLGLDKSDNIFYFALYLTYLHRNNESHLEKEKGKKPKRIYNKAFKKEINIKTIIESALPNHKNLFSKFEEYKNNNSRGKYFFGNMILGPLQETINIYVKHGYIDENYKIPSYSKNILNQNIEIIFVYDIKEIEKRKKII